MRNVSIASFWNVVIILVQFTLSPVISRLYSPAEYGVYVLFSSFVINITFFSHFRYGDAVILTTSSRQRDNVFSLSIILIVVVSTLSLLFIFLFKQPLTKLFKLPLGNSLVYLIPLSVLLGSIMELLLVVNVGRKKFSNNGLAGFLNGAGSRGVTIMYAVAQKAIPIGLVLGDISGKVLALIGLTFSFRKPLPVFRRLVKETTIVRMREVAQHFRSFPFYFLPSNFLVTFSAHLPLYVFQYQYGAAVVGAYALASSMLEIFNRLVPYTISSVFLQKAIELRDMSHRHLSTKTYRLFLYLLLVATIIFSGFALLGDIVFPWVFGEKWSIAGTFITMLAISYTFNFIGVALTEVYKVMGRQRLLLGISVGTVVVKILVLMLIFFLDLKVAPALFTYSAISALASMVQVIGVFVILRYNVIKVLTLLMASLGVLLMVWSIGLLF